MLVRRPCSIFGVKNVMTSTIVQVLTNHLRHVPITCDLTSIVTGASRLMKAEMV
jgi:hypothetical protein